MQLFANKYSQRLEVIRLAEEENISRAQFFRTALKKSLSTALDLAENFTGPAERLANFGLEWQVVFTGSLPENQTKLVFHHSKPFFLLRDELRIQAFSGLCPHDSILLVARPNRSFLCSFCSRNFHADAVEDANKLQEYPVRAEGEKILLAF